ncbi:MAG TPA: type I secretion system permease/ATPase [Methyloceanibacter sp.]|nr:type I secretion system permease/ATPase [Methyloceanibacter sp.]
MPKMAPAKAAQSGLADALGRYRTALLGVFLFSALINILMLTGPLFMLQIYDRVLPSRSIPTLVGFAVLTAALFAFQGVLDALRGRVLLRIGGSINEDLVGRAYDAVLRLPLISRGGGDGLQPIRDLDQIRQFLGSPGPGALFDLPWMPFYVAVCFLFHPWIGIAAAGGAIFLIILTLCAELATRTPAKTAVEIGARRNALLEASRRNAEVMHAMGMSPRFSAQFGAVNDEFLQSHKRATDRAGVLSAMSRITRLMLQSFVLGLGAYLVIHHEATAGIIIASSILVSRALAPVDLAIGNWKGFVAARHARQRLQALMLMLPEREEPLALPKPRGALVVEAVTAVPPGTQRIVLQEAAFTLAAGEGLGVIGPSASGKSSLARLLVGVWHPARGKVQLDGAALDQWSPEILGQHLGYLPQSVELFDGSVADNIGRFEPTPDADAIIAAAKAAGVHDLIVKLPEGYDTKIGESGTNLSSGQRQRIALARALFRDPFLVVLDEPNSNLDSEGEEALTAAILSVRARGGIVIVIAHRASVLGSVDHVLVLNQGRQQAFGPRDEVLRSVLRPATAPLTVVAGNQAVSQ